MKKSPEPLRVLCAEDNDLLGDVLVRLFANEGFWVEHAENGLIAWGKVSGANEAPHFDVLVTDHEMPGLDGLGLVERVRARGLPMRVIVHTSGLPLETAAHYHRLGVNAIVLKGCQPDNLLQAVKLAD